MFVLLDSQSDNSSVSDAALRLCNWKQNSEQFLLSIFSILLCRGETIQNDIISP